MVLPMPTSNEEWIHIDMTTGIRAIYIPLSQQASSQYPEYCTFLQINFTRDAKVVLADWTGDNIETVPMDKIDGLGPDRKKVLALNVPGIINLLSLPRQLRKYSIYKSGLIKWYPTAKLATVPVTASYRDGTDFSFLHITKANVGLDIQYAPAQYDDFLASAIKNSIYFALGFVGPVGWLGQIAFGLAWTAILNPEGFVDELRSQIPGLMLFEIQVEMLKNACLAARPHVATGWVAAGTPMHMSPFYIVKNNLTVDIGPGEPVDQDKVNAELSLTQKRLEKSAKLGIIENQVWSEEAKIVLVREIGIFEGILVVGMPTSAPDALVIWKRVQADPAGEATKMQKIKEQKEAEARDPVRLQKEDEERRKNASPGSIDWPYYYMQKAMGLSEAVK